MYLCKKLEDFGFPNNYSVSSKTDVFDFLMNISNDKSGYLTKEKDKTGTRLNALSGFPKYFPELYNEYLQTSFPEEAKEWRFCQKLWHFLQDDYELKLGHCCVCGKRCKFQNTFKKNYRTFCSLHCQNNSVDVLSKRYNTRIKNSGSIEESYKNGLIKCRETRIKNSGSVEQSYKNGVVKMIETSKEKYNGLMYTQTTEYKERFLIKKDDKLRKEYITKKKNKSFNSSKIEKQVKDYLIKNDILFNEQYRDDLYPFNCDFYLLDYKLYIEINGNWTHGGHEFDEQNKCDIETLRCWEEKSKTSKYYKNAIYVWTDLDVRKRNTAIYNKLNFIEVFSTNINYCISKINNEINKIKENL